MAYVGYRTSQLSLYSESPEDGVQCMFLKGVSALGIGEEPMVYYHSVVHRTADDAQQVQQREQFRHPVPAQDWLLETVPDFDLVETISINVPDEDLGPTAPGR